MPPQRQSHRSTRRRRRSVPSDPSLVTRFFDLPPSYQLMWRMSAPHWHGIARADVFLTPAGPQVCELNSDTPSGEPEAVALNRVVDGAGASGFDDPNCRLGDRVFAMVRAVVPAGAPHDGRNRLPDGDDRRFLGHRSLRAVVRIAWHPSCPWVAVQPAPGWTWRRRAVRGFLLGHLEALQDRLVGRAAHDLAVRVALLRCRPAFGAARPARGRDRARELRGGEPIRCRADPEQANDGFALGGARSILGTRRARSFAVMSRSRRGWKRCATPRLREEQPLWVLKSDYGCEGEEVVIGADTTAAAWADALSDALPTRWIAQRRFQPFRDRGGQSINYGVYLVAGRAAGLFTRLQSGGTDRRATLCTHDREDVMSTSWWRASLRARPLRATAERLVGAAHLDGRRAHRQRLRRCPF